MVGENNEKAYAGQILKRINQIREILNEVYYLSYMDGSDESTKLIISRCMDELIAEYVKLNQKSNWE